MLLSLFAVIHLCSDAEVFEKPLVGGPELSPHGFARSLVEVEKLRGFLETVSGGDPEFHALIVDVDFVHLVHRHFANAEGDSGEGELAGDVTTPQLHVHGYQLHGADTTTFNGLIWLRIDVEVHIDYLRIVVDQRLTNLNESIEVSERGSLSPKTQPRHVCHIFWFCGSGGRRVNNACVGKFLLELQYARPC